MSDDYINHPSHYGGGDNPYEAIKVIESWGWGYEGCMFNAVKYLLRAGKKNGESDVRDLRKALWYIDRAMQPQNKRVEWRRFPGQPGHLNVHDIIRAHKLSRDLGDVLTLVYLEDLPAAKGILSRVIECGVHLTRSRKHPPSVQCTNCGTSNEVGSELPPSCWKCQHDLTRTIRDMPEYPKEGHKLASLTLQERTHLGED